MKQLLALITILVLATFTFAQTQTPGSPAPRCTLTLAQSPTIRGVKLGMTAEEVLALFPGRSENPTIRAALNDAPKAFGVARFGVSISRDDKPFDGVNQFDFEFLDNQLTSFYLGYNGPEWKNVDEFISRLSSSLKMPAVDYWEPHSLETNYKSVKCAGFDVRVAVTPGGSSNYVRVSDPRAPQTVTVRQNEVKERARREFKP